MKYFNYVLSLFMMFSCVYLLATSISDTEVIMSFFALMSAIIFLLFALLEERKEEIDRLKETILKYRGV